MDDFGFLPLKQLAMSTFCSKQFYTHVYLCILTNLMFRAPL